MVVKIQPPCSSLSRVLSYNDRKVDTGTCEIVGIWNAGTSDPDAAYRVLEDYARGSRRTRDVVFHASVNPSPTDGMDRSRALRFMMEMMSQLGYGAQPMVFFEHNDTGRTHYHIVSVRVDSEGYKIPDLYENRRCSEIISSLQEKYGFTVGRGEGIPRSSDEYDLTSDLTSRIEKALRYRCTSMPQLSMVLQTLGVKLIESPSGEMSFRLTDREGKGVSPAIDADDLMIPSREDIEKTLSSHKWSNEDTFRRRSRVNGCVKAALDGCPSDADFRRKLTGKGIDVVYSRTDEGRVFGVTFIDHTSRSVFKGSELEKGLSASTFQQLFETVWNEKGNNTSDATVHGGAAAAQKSQTMKDTLGAELTQALISGAFDATRRYERDPQAKKKRRKRRM